MLKAQDIVVLLKVAVAKGGWTFAKLADELDMSASAVHRSLERAEVAGLYNSGRRRIKVRELQEFLAHGVRYAFPPVNGGEGRGMTTAWGAPPLKGVLSSSEHNPPVWRDARGKARGIVLRPLHPSVPSAARKDRSLYELLALVDAIRIGGARERNLAVKWLDRLLPKG